MKKLMWKEKMTAVMGLSLVAVALASCGGSNKSNVPVAQDTSQSTTETATVQGTDSCQTSSSWADFKSRVANMNFVKNSNIRETYYFNDYHCQQKDILWGAMSFNSCSGSRMTRSINTDTGFIKHESGNSVEAVRDYLSSLVNSAVDATGGGTYYDVKTSSGDLYRIDLCKPIVANPIIWLNSSQDEAQVYYGRTTY